MRKNKTFTVRFGTAVLASFLISNATYALVINPMFVNGQGETWTTARQNLINYAISDWTSVFSDAYEIDMTFDFTSAGTGGYLAQWATSVSYYTGDDVMPWYQPADPGGVTHTIHFNVDLFNTGLDNYSWFDSTPATDGDLPFEAWDLLSVARHELGHALGYSNGYFAENKGALDELLVWDDKITINGSDATFDAGGGFIYDLAAINNLGHTKNSGSTTNDLMNPSLFNGQRRDISTANTNMLSAAYGYTVIPEPAVAALLVTFGSGLLVCKRIFGE